MGNGAQVSNLRVKNNEQRAGWTPALRCPRRAAPRDARAAGVEMFSRNFISLRITIRPLADAAAGVERVAQRQIRRDDERGADEPARGAGFHEMPHAGDEDVDERERQHEFPREVHVSRFWLPIENPTNCMRSKSPSGA